MAPGQRDSETPSNAIESGSGGGGGAGRFVRAALAPFGDCNAFLAHVKAEARERVGPYGLDQHGWWYLEGDMVEVTVADAADAGGVEEAAEEPASESAGNATAGGDADATYTGTNVQELGVDEPDIIKTDGDRILVVRDNRLIHIDISDGTPRLTDEVTIPEGWGHELFFLGERAVLFTNGGAFHPEPIPVDDATTDAEAEFSDVAEPSSVPDQWTPPAAIVVQVDLSDPNDLEIDATLEIEGQYLSARRVDDMIRLAVSTGPQQLPWLVPQTPAGEDRAEESNRELIDESTLDDWIPGFHLTTGSNATSGSLVECANLNHPAEFSGFDVVSVIDIDLTTGLAGGFDPANATGILAGGQTVYSSLDRFYVATTKWIHQDDVSDGTVPREWSEDYETELHAFAIAPGEPARYTASGTVAGSLLNQFSLDEHDGYLRVVTTDGSPWDARNVSESGLTVFAERGDLLVQVGHVGGLGKGEQLYSARLLDDVGFAVTFRQIDPFYVLDLSDPTNPRVSGELKIPGFSTYLHPIDDSRVLGIGQDATDEGQVLGLKVSVFDVSDPANPRETAVWTLPGANSPAEYDHRAFQIHGSTVILPVQDWSAAFSGAVVLDIADGAVHEIGRVEHVPDGQTGSDCRQLTVDDFPEEDSSFYWEVRSGAIVQVCGPNHTGGWSGETGGCWSESPELLTHLFASPEA